MSGTPKFKCFRGKEYVAAIKHAEDVAVLISAGVIDRVSYDRAVWVWSQSDDANIAANSYDDAAEIMWTRLNRHSIRTLRKMGHSNQAIVSKFGHAPEDVAAA